jgi:hypothetical protein
MPTCDAARATGMAAAALTLAACQPTGLAGTPTSAAVNVAGRAIGVAAPPGFCIDGASSSITRAGAFVLMSDCAALGVPGAARGPAAGTALTASISTGGLGGEGDDPLQSLADLEEFAVTPEGLALLGRSGTSQGVRILDTQQSGGVLYVLVEDRGPQPIAGAEPRFWRAFLELDGHLTVLSVLGFEGAGVDGQSGLNLLASLAAALRQANPA